MRRTPAAALRAPRRKAATPKPTLQTFEAEVAQLEKEKAMLERVIRLRAEVADLRVTAALAGKTDDGLRAILAVVSQGMGCPLDLLLSRRRTDDVAWPRMVACHLARLLTNLCSTQIGTVLQRDHSTVLYAVNAVSDRRVTDHAFDAQVAELEAECRSRMAVEKKDTCFRL